jgi:hypothetical protein
VLRALVSLAFTSKKGQAYSLSFFGAEDGKQSFLCQTRFEAFATLKENASVFRAKSTRLTRLYIKKRTGEQPVLF